MTTHTSIQSGTSQCAKILARLKETPGQWVEMPDLVNVSGSYNIHSRISDLRKRGERIGHKNTTVNRKTHSFYRLLTDEGRVINASKPLDLVPARDG